MWKISNLISNLVFQLVAALREVRYLKLICKDGIPNEALSLFESDETYFNYIFNLNLIIGW